MKLKCPALISAFLLLAAQACAGPIFNIVDLGNLGGASSQAYGINASGIAVGSATNPFGYTHAFSSSGSLTDLTINSHVSEGVASGINNAGAVAGTQYFNGQAYATLWLNDIAQSISGPGSSAMAINDSGQTAGMFTTADSQGHAFIADGVNPGDSFADLGPLPGGTWSAAYGINSAGNVAGYGNIASGPFRGFTWSADGGYTQLGTFGGANSYAMTINSAGDAAGSAQTSDGSMHAFLAIGAQLIDLGTLGGMSSYAYGMNDDREVVGYSSINASGDTHAFLVDHGVMIDLNSLIDSSRWTLTHAYAINASGQIVGSGLFNGVEHAFRLDNIRDLDSNSTALSQSAVTSAATPEPGNFGTVLLGTALLVCFRIRPVCFRTQRTVRLLPPHVSRPRAHWQSRVSPR